MRGDRKQPPRTMIAAPADLARRLKEFQCRLQACRLKEEKLGLLFPGLAKVSLIATLDWLLVVAQGDLVAQERKLDRLLEQRGFLPTDLDKPPPAA